MSRKLSLIGFVFFLIYSSSSYTASATQTDVKLYSKTSFKHYVAERKKRLLSADGWVSLAGLYWVKQGLYGLGSAPDNNIVFPASAPAHVGKLLIKDKQIQFFPSDPAVTINNKQLKQGNLSVKGQTRVQFGSFSFFMIEREKGYAIRLKDAHNPALKTFKPFDFYPYNPELVVKAKLIKSPAAKKSLLIQTVYGTFRHEKSAGFLSFDIDGKNYQLQAVDDGPDEPLFIMFKDGTSEKSTYGAGRYLDVAHPDKNGETIIDFNRAYNPPCAFTHFATCPLPPRSNQLKVKINAGEKYHHQG